MSFKDLKAHPAVADQLRRSLANGRLAHAYLFTGPRQSGKEVAARTLAQALNCERTQHDACDACPTCRRIAAGQHPDIHWVRPESKSRRIKIEQVREFEHAVNLKATQARIKVGIITDAECLTEEASNAFLKSLEEPPAQTIILLLSAEPQRLLPTLLSRCLRLAFGSTAGAPTPYRDLVLPVMVEFSHHSHRSIAGAYQLHAALTGLLLKLRGEIRHQVEAELDLDRYAELDPKVRERLEDQLEARVEGEYRSAREQVLETLYSWYGDVLLCVERAPVEFLEHPEQAAALQQAAQPLSFARAASQLDAVEQIRDALNRNISEALALEVGLLHLLASA